MSDATQPAVIMISIVPHTGDDREKLARGVAALMREDPAITISSGPASGESVLFGAGEQHLEIVIDGRRLEYGVSAAVGRPRVAYLETVSRAARGEMKY